MCVFNRPSPPPLPKPVETAPRPEKTAERVVVGSQRRPGSTRRGRRSRTLGTASLQIPLLNEGQTGMGNLNY